MKQRYPGQSTPLSSKVFKKYQNKLAEEWEELKKEYKIKTD